MSVQNNYLVFPDKKYLIYTLSSDGAIHLTEKFLTLWNAFFPGNPFAAKEGTTEVILPRINPSVLTGKLDALSGYVDFTRAISQTNAAITTDGVALNFFTSNGRNLDYKLEWEASPSVDYVNFYFWNATQQQIRYNVDCCQHISTYKGHSGNAILPDRNGFMYVKVISTSPDFVLNLKVTALAPSDCLHLPSGKHVCLHIHGQNVPLYTASIIENNTTIIPDPQWQYIASLIKNTIQVIYAQNIPLTPLDLGQSQRFSVRTVVPQILIPTYVAVTDTLQTQYLSGSVAYTDRDSVPVPTDEAIRDRNRAIQAVYIDKYGTFQKASAQLVLFTITITGIPAILQETQCTAYCYSESNPFYWPAYEIAKSRDGIFKTSQTVGIPNSSTLSIDLYVRGAIDVNFVVNFLAPPTNTLSFTSALYYPVV
jgi:hypothetical protein